ERDEIIGEVEAARGPADDRHDDVADQRIDDGAEGRTDDDTDREVDDVALEGKFAKFLEHGLLPSMDRWTEKARPAQVQLIRPACTMALRTAMRVVSETGTIGSRSVSSILPSSDIAYLTGAGLDSMKRLLCSGISLSCSASAALASPFCQARWNSEHNRGATFEVTEMQPWPPWAMKPSAEASSPESWMNSLPQASRCSDTR